MSDISDELTKPMLDNIEKRVSLSQKYNPWWERMIYAGALCTKLFAAALHLMQPLEAASQVNPGYDYTVEARPNVSRGNNNKHYTLFADSEIEELIWPPDDVNAAFTKVLEDSSGTWVLLEKVENPAYQDSVAIGNTSVSCLIKTDLYGKKSLALVNGNGENESDTVFVDILGINMAVSQDHSEVSHNLFLWEAQPNPSNSRVLFPYKGDNIELVIYNVLGQEIDRFKCGEDIGECVWNGMDKTGITVGSGIYFAEINFSGIKYIRKFTIMR